jgi:hypothetical protein
MLLAVTALAVLLPLQGASAWRYSGGYRGYGGGYDGGRQGYHGHGGGYYGGYPGYRGYHGGYRGYRGYYGGYRGYSGGCWNCGAAGAAFVGLAVGAIVGSAIANASQPPVVVGPAGPPSACDSVIVGGIPYYNCGGYNPRPYWGGYGAVEGWQSK